MKQEIKRNHRNFAIDASDAYSCWWFQQRFPGWEEHTFQVLEHFLKPGKIYLDIGAWIGPTLLYAASMGVVVHGIEPDPVAFQRLMKNVLANPLFTDIYLHSLALASEAGQQLFGGNGELGNSESSLLINDPLFIQQGGLDQHWKGDDSNWRKGQQTQVNCLTLADFLVQQDMAIEDICLIKIDIEGSEKLMLPGLAAALKDKRPPLYISLHRVFLQEFELQECLKHLSNLYALYTPEMKRVNTTEILETHQEDILCLPDQQSKNME